MNLIVVYKGIDKIAVDQLKKLVDLKDDNGEKIIGIEDGELNIVPMEEKVYLDNSKVTIFNDPILFIGNVKPGQDIIPIAEPKSYGFGVVCGFAGPQAVLTNNVRVLFKPKNYDDFLTALNSLTYQQVSPVPTGFFAVLEIVGRGYLGAKKRLDDLKKQQLIYGVTKLYYEDLREFMNNHGKKSLW